MNDLINNVLERYKSFKKGDRSASAEINPAYAASGTKSSKNSKAAAAPNLIDFDEPEASISNGNGKQQAGNPMDDNFGLEGLHLGGSTAAPNTASSGSALLDGLMFGNQPSSGQQSQTNFYQQYQPTLPSGASQQPSISWANLSAQPAPTASRPSSTLAPSASQQQGTYSPMASPLPPSSPARSGALTPQSAQRPTTPGAINLGMMGSLPPTTPSGHQRQGSRSSANSGTPSLYQQQSNIQGASNAQSNKPKDPFDDLLSF